MAVTGIFASNQSMVGNRRGDFAANILRIWPTGMAPLLALSSGMKQESAADSIVNWFEENKIVGRTNTVSGGTSTTVVVGDGSSFVPGTILFVEDTGEYIRVEANNGANSLTVVRGMAGTTTTSIDNTMNVTRVGNAFEEGSTMPNSVVNQGSLRTNYTQIFRNAWAVTGTTKAIDYRTGDQLAKSRSEAAFFHAEDQERAFWWGKKDIRNVNGKPFRMMDGLITQIEQYGGTVETLSDGKVSQFILRDYLRQIFAKNIKGEPNERLCFAGDLALQNMAESAGRDGNHEFQTAETDFGFKFHRFLSSFGDINVVTHPLMNENPYFQTKAYFIHPGGIKLRHLRKTKSEGYDTDGNRIDGKDADEGVITTEVAITAMAAETMGVMNNISDSKVSYA